MLATPASLRKPLRVLVADDNADMRDYLRRLLADQYEVTGAADGEEALRQVRLNPPDLVLADIMMPVLDGIALLNALRADPSTRSLPVILLSARAGETQGRAGRLYCCPQKRNGFG
jgi:CheY-like chemotaxis protein